MKHCNTCRCHVAPTMIGDVILDEDSLALVRGCDAVRLTPLDFDLARYYAANSGRLIGRKEILSSVWRDDSGIVTRVVDIHTQHLRRALKQIGAAGAEIVSVRGAGYRLDIATVIGEEGAVA